MSNNPLVLRFQADTASASRAIANMATSGAAQIAALGTASALAGQKMDRSLLSTLFKIAGGVTAVQAAYAGFATVAAASLAIAIDRLSEYRKLADDAARVGVSTAYFQRFVQGAGAAKDSVDAMVGALRAAKEAVRDRLDAPSQVGERLAEFASNSTFLDPINRAFRSAENQEARISAVVAALDELLARGYRLEALDLAEKMFGKQAAADLIERARASGQSLAMMIETTENKQIVSDQQIANAKELELRLTAARREMSDAMVPLLRDLETLGTALYRGWVNTEEAIAGAVGALGRMYSLLRDTVALIPSFQAIPGTVEQSALQAQLGNLNRQIANLDRLPISDPRRDSLVRQREVLQSRIGAIQGADMLARDAVPFVPVPTEFQTRAPLPPRQRLGGRDEGGPVRTGGGSGSSETDAYEKLLGSIEKVNAALRAEYETLGLNKFEREYAVALAKAEADLKEKGRELSTAERDELKGKIEEQARYKALIEETNQRLEQAKAFQQFAGNNVSSFLSDIISGGKNASDALMNLTKRLADAALQAALLGQGPLAGLLGFGAKNGNGVGGLIGTLFSGFSGAFGGGAGGGMPNFGFASPVARLATGTSRVPFDNMPALLHKNEMVVPAYDANLIRRGGMGGGTVVNILPAPGTRLARQEERNDGGQNVKTLVFEAVKDGYATGEFDQSMRRFGNRPVAVRR